MPRSCRLAIAVAGNRRADRDRRAAPGERRRSPPFRRALAPEPRLKRVQLRVCLLERGIERPTLQPRVVGVLHDPKLLRAAPGRRCRRRCRATPQRPRGRSARPNAPRARRRRERQAPRRPTLPASSPRPSSTICDSTRTASPASGPAATISMRSRSGNLQRHDADHAPRVHFVVAPPQPDVRGELLRAAGEDRRRPCMQPGRIRDDERSRADHVRGRNARPDWPSSARVMLRIVSAPAVTDPVAACIAATRSSRRHDDLRHQAAGVCRDVVGIEIDQRIASAHRIADAAPGR